MVFKLFHKLILLALVLILELAQDPDEPTPMTQAMRHQLNKIFMPVEEQTLILDLRKAMFFLEKQVYFQPNKLFFLTPLRRMPLLLPIKIL